MKPTYSYKRITDEQITHALNLGGSASPLAKLGATTGYPLDKCLLALKHAEKRGLIQRLDGQVVLTPGRIRGAGPRGRR